MPASEYLRSIADRDLESPNNRLKALRDIGRRLCQAANLLDTEEFAPIHDWCNWARQGRPYEWRHAVCLWYIIDELENGQYDFPPLPATPNEITTGQVDAEFVRKTAESVAGILARIKSCNTVQPDVPAIANKQKNSRTTHELAPDEPDSFLIGTTKDTPWATLYACYDELSTKYPRECDARRDEAIAVYLKSYRRTSKSKARTALRSRISDVNNGRARH